MWIGMGVSCVGMAMILTAQAMRFANEPDLNRYTVACKGVVANVTVHTPRELTDSEQDELRKAACQAIEDSLEARFDES